MDRDRRTTVGILGGLLALALPSAAAAQKPPSPNMPLPPPTLPPPSASPSALSPSRVPSPAESPRDAASQKAVSDLLNPLARSRRPDAYELADGGILLIENGRAFRLALGAAPDGRYDLSRSGTIMVQGSRAVGVVGQPGAVMAPAGLP